jgi:quinol monooxygenase YgiN
MYCVTVLFDVQPEHADDFAHRVARQAADSLEKEEQCHVFDVWTSPDRPNSTYLYEIYADREAFDEHLKSEHFIAFDRAVAPWVVEKKVVTWERKS